MAKLPYKFGEFAPDAPEYDTGVIEDLENAIPLYGGYRGVQKARSVSSHNEADEIATGAHTHLLSSDFNKQEGRAVDDYSGWSPVDVCNENSEDTDLYLSINEAVPEDAKFNIWLDSTQNPTPTGDARYDIQTIVDPTVYTDIFLKIRYRGWIDNGVGNLQYFLGEGGSLIDSETIDTTTTPESGEGNWQYAEIELTPALVATITDWSNLSIGWYTYIDSMSAANPLLVHYPNEDVNNVGNWVGHDDGTIAMYSYINDIKVITDSEDDATYIKTPDLLGGAVSAYIGALSTTGRDINTHYHFTNGDQPQLEIKIRAKVANKDATNLDVYLQRNQPGAPSEGVWDRILATHAFTANDTWEEISLPILYANLQNYDVDNLKYKLEFSHDYGTGSPQSELPSADVAVNNYEDEGGATTNLYQSINDSSDTTYVTYTASSSSEKYRFKISAMEDPGSYQDDDVKITWRTKTTSGIEPNVRFKIFYNGTSNSYTSAWQEVPKTITDMEWGLTAAQAESLDWGSDFIVEVEYSAYRTIRLYEVGMEAGETAGSGSVSEVWCELEGYQGYEVSWMGIEFPSVDDELIGDQQKIYVGSSTHLLEAAETGLWTDISRASNYNQASVEAQAWDFCSWGGDVIATNHQDPVQILELEGGATIFKDLILGTTAADYEVRAKFCDIVGEHLVLCNIGAVEDFGVPTTYNDAYSYTVWWSKINDPYHFAIADYTNLSDLQHLRSTRGEITGFIGGEYGTIFKRDSIYRMSWVGGALVFRFDLLASGIGTGHPKSIVARDQDIFFYGHNDFYVMPSGGKPQPLGIGKVKSILTELGFDRRAINRSGFEKQIEHDLRITGTYDQFSGLIFWAIDNSVISSSYSKKTDILVLNPTDGRWGYIRDSAFDVTDDGIGLLVSTPNIPNDEFNILNNLHIVTNRTVATKDYIEIFKLNDTTYGLMTIDSGTLTSQAFGSEGSTTISAVRPMYDRLSSIYSVGGDRFDPPFEGVMYASSDPLMISSTSATFSSDYMNENGWAQLSNILSGEFWSFQITIPEYDTTSTRDYSLDGAIKTILGLQLEAKRGATSR